MTNIVDEVLEEFPHKPDGMIARHLAHEAAREQAKAAHSETTEYGRDHVKAVRTIVEAADLTGATMLLLNSSKQISRLLPLDRHRRKAVILAVDNDVYLTQDESVALGIAGTTTSTQGFYLPAGIPLPYESQSQIWAAVTTTNNNSRVSVLIFRESA